MPTESPHLPRALENIRAETIEKLRTLDALRQRQLDADMTIETMERALFESASYKTVQNEALNLKDQIALVEREIKAAGLDAYHANPENKKPAPGVASA